MHCIRTQAGCSVAAAGPMMTIAVESPGANVADVMLLMKCQIAAANTPPLVRLVM